MKKTMCFLMALALVLGLTQCKKEKPQTQGVRITLDVDGGNSKVDVNPTGGGTYATVTFQNGDIIYVGNSGSYCGYLQHDGTHFTGSINAASLSQDDYLHFYFMGNKGTTSQPSSVNITDQTSEYPVISYAHSTVKYTSGITHYSAKLQNYCAIVKFTTTDIDADITITGMKNTVTVDFAANNAATSTTGNPYSFSKDGDGNITLHRVSNAARWAILLPQNEVTTATATATGYASEGTFTVPEITANMYSNTGVNISMTAVWDGDLAHITSESTEAFATATNGMTITGTLGVGVNKKISIADGATVTLNNATINGTNNSSYKWAGITCLGDATIILSGTNTVKGFYDDYPGIQAAAGNTLTINGTGSLTASSNGYGAGIGGGNKIACGNIEIQGGTVEATGGNQAAGIGGGSRANCGTITISGGTVTARGGSSGAGIGSSDKGTCGDITISGGTVTARGGNSGAGIGSGLEAGCGDITITSGVTQVTATKGGANSIGAGFNGSCGTVTFGNATVYSGSAWSPNPMVAGNYGGLTLAISTTTNTNDTWTLTPAPPVPSIPEGAIDGLFTINGSGDQVYFSQGNLKYSAGTWSFHTNQYDMCFTSTGDVSSYYDVSGTFDLFGYGTSGNDGKYPYMTDMDDDYYQGNIAGTEYDWGTNAISNGGNTANFGWRTLTKDEWRYLLEERTTTSNVLYAKSTVNGVAGLIILPDDWSTSYYDFEYSANSPTASFSTITIDLSTWTSALEAHGAVFLPVFSFREGTVIAYIEGYYSYYWSSTYQGYDSGPGAFCAFYLTLEDYLYSSYPYSNVSTNTYGPIFAGAFVRLVKDAN